MTDSARERAEDEYQRLWHEAARERDHLRGALRDLCAALDGWTGGSSPWLEAFCAGNEALSEVANPNVDTGGQE